jgi:hypothetical protein
MKLIFAASMILACATTSAIAEPRVPNEDATKTMYLACKALRENTSSTQQLVQCMRLIGYLDGFRTGARHGAATAFLNDDQNLATTKGKDDFLKRLDAVLPAAQCVPPSATRGQVMDVFITYVDEHPASLVKDYAQTLEFAIEDHYCP